MNSLKRSISTLAAAASIALVGSVPPGRGGDLGGTAEATTTTG